jgi:hypothetical protein
MKGLGLLSRPTLVPRAFRKCQQPLRVALSASGGHLAQFLSIPKRLECAKRRAELCRSFPLYLVGKLENRCECPRRLLPACWDTDAGFGSPSPVFKTSWSRPSQLDTEQISRAFGCLVSIVADVQKEHATSEPPKLKGLPGALQCRLAAKSPL